MLDEKFLKSLIDRPHPVILDVGANNGDQSKAFARIFPSARIYAFEPDPRAIARFKANVLSPTVHLVQKAVGRQNGMVQFHQSSGQPPTFDQDGVEHNWPSDWDLSGSIRAPKEHITIHPWCKFDSIIDVEITTLDSWALSEGLDFVDFIWADVQGAEEDLILGGKGVLSRTKNFYTEYSNFELYSNSISMDKIISLLENFEVSKIFENDILFKNTGIPTV